MLKLSIHEFGTTTLFRCTGRIVAGEAHLLGAAVRTHPQLRKAVLDFAEISALDAAGLGVLISLLTWAQAMGVQLKLLNLRPRVEEVLELTRLRPLFDVCSVHDMMDLLCRALDQDRFGGWDPVNRLQDHPETDETFFVLEDNLPSIFPTASSTSVTEKCSSSVRVHGISRARRTRSS